MEEYLFKEERELTNDALGRAALYNLTSNMAAVTEHANTVGPDDIKHDIYKKKNFT